ncbi:MAG: glutathione S-transferase N-terminal domain-containing protein [Alphaproteobacteria bacterium]|nr:glutathione S-transferase N-terminal domain-containing protein [Alphaproteobacteria bacterium]MBV9693003.1 glutathione S-transferase N-terminal domain-containing protein [Alphaproteobacteria bacterium]
MAKAKAAASRRLKTVRKAAAKPAPKSKQASKPKTAVKAKPPAPPKSRTDRPIQLYYWPTPNGWKISIMLEECALPYVMVPVNIGKGEQFEPEFLAISPNNRMPAIVDPAGPGGKPISVFESGAILQYLGRKTGKFYPRDERARVAVEEWLFWQMAGLGPMTGQANHFLNYAREGNDYARKRYVDEVHRLLGVMNKRLASYDYLAGDYSIADMACWGWVIGASRMHDIGAEFPHVKAWRDEIGKRPAVERGFALGRALREQQNADPKAQEEARRVLFGQRART